MLGINSFKRIDRSKARYCYRFMDGPLSGHEFKTVPIDFSSILITLTDGTRLDYQVGSAQELIAVQMRNLYFHEGKHE